MAIADWQSMLLLIDDDLRFRQALTRALSIEGYEVESAANGAEGLEWLNRCTTLPELIVLDLVMPVLDGWRFLTVRANDPRIAKVPVVIISSADGNDKRGELACAAAVLGKPFRIEALLDVVEEFGIPTKKPQ
jgi:DNA-binding response OmpR family regulator